MKNLAIAYGMKKRKKMMQGNACEHGKANCEMCHGGNMAEGGEIGMGPTYKDPYGMYENEDPKSKGRRTHLGELEHRRKKSHHHMMAEGGMMEEDEDDDMISRIMSGRQKAQIANDTSPIADFEENQFDELVKNDDESEPGYTGENSGDEIGNKHLEEDEHDMIARIMRSRKMKDRMSSSM